MSYIKTASVILALSMIISIILTYASLISIVSSTKLNLERVLNSFVTRNSSYIYDSIRDGTDFTSQLDAEYFVFMFDLDHTLVMENGFLYNLDSDGEYVFKLSTPEITFDTNNTLNLVCRTNMYIPIYFAGEKITDLNIPLRVKTSYTLKE